MFTRFTATQARLLAAILLACCAALSPTDAVAQDIYVEVDHAKLLKLDADADLIYVVNPSIADITVETPRMLFVVGLTPGQTGIHILDRQGKELIVGDILVTPNESHEVALNRNSQEITYSCSPRCSEVAATGQANADAFDTSGGGDNFDTSGGGDNGDVDMSEFMSGLGLTE